MSWELIELNGEDNDLINYLDNHCIFCDKKFTTTMHTNNMQEVVDLDNNKIKDVVRCDSCLNYVHKNNDCSQTYDETTIFYSLPQYNYPKAILCQGCEQDEEVLYPSGKALYEMEDE
jgi:hypothetical protein